MIIIIIIKIINNNDGSGRISFCPDLLVKLFNGILESGLTPEFVAPNSILPWTYPEGGGYARHCDSRHRFGDVMVCRHGGCYARYFYSTNIRIYEIK